MTTPYVLAPFCDTDDGTVWCNVTWTSRGGEHICSTADYLDLVDGKPRLTCGIYHAAEHLGFPPETLDDPKYCLSISALVDRQLARAPRARLHCPEGVLDIALVAPWQEPDCEFSQPR
ncbi:hypothetical protein [Mycobacteroides abscessus]|uniref:hypothetical protein n=1 Tax=Mycobacteroides abscessus TaxID=36809 RepID=UPI00104242EE|nr:hypothetical protein [Mycobacteroides abscessus]